MLKKIISVIVLIAFIFVFTFSAQTAEAAFVVDDALVAAFIASLAASIVISIGYGVVTGSGSVYQSAAEQIGRDLSLGVSDFQYYIRNGVPYFSVDGNYWNSLRNFILQKDWSDFHAISNVNIAVGGYPNFGSAPLYENFRDYIAVGEKDSLLSINHNGYSITYMPGQKLNAALVADGSILKSRNAVNFSSAVNIIGLTCFSSSGTTTCYPAYKQGGQLANTVDEAYQFHNYNSSYGGAGMSFQAADIFYKGSSISHSIYFSYSSSTGKTRICWDNNSNPFFISSLSFNQWSTACLNAGQILTNVTNSVSEVNTNPEGTETELPVTIANIPADFNEAVDDGQKVNIPLKGNLVIPGTDTPLTKEQIEERVNNGEALELVPDVPQYQDNKLPAPVLVTNGATIPGVTDVPVYVPGYPDVTDVNTPDISVTANDDIFPTVSAPATDVPSEGATVGVSEIVSDAVQDIAEPLSPGDVQTGTNRMKLPQLLIKKFPFCIPFDFYNGIKVLSADAEAPHWKIPFNINSLNIQEEIDLDMSKYESAAVVVRWFILVTWTIGLILLTRKVIWK